MFATFIFGMGVAALVGMVVKAVVAACVERE